MCCHCHFLTTPPPSGFHQRTPALRARAGVMHRKRRSAIVVPGSRRGDVDAATHSTPPHASTSHHHPVPSSPSTSASPTYGSVETLAVPVATAAAIVHLSPSSVASSHSSSHSNTVAPFDHQQQQQPQQQHQQQPNYTPAVATVAIASSHPHQSPSSTSSSSSRQNLIDV